MNSGGQHAIAVITGNAAPIVDSDPRSREEREVNRLWAAIRHAGDSRLVAATEQVEKHLESRWPEIRAESLSSLCRFGNRAALERARATAVNEDRDPIERGLALDALAAAPEGPSKADRELARKLTGSEDLSLARPAKNLLS